LRFVENIFMRHHQLKTIHRFYFLVVNI
jgi:hypothetical protein